MERVELGELVGCHFPSGMVAAEGQGLQRLEPWVALAVVAVVVEEEEAERCLVVRRYRKNTQALIEERRARKMLRRWVLAAR